MNEQNLKYWIQFVKDQHEDRTGNLTYRSIISNLYDGDSVDGKTHDALLDHFEVKMHDEELNLLPLCPKCESAYDGFCIECAKGE